MTSLSDIPRKTLPFASACSVALALLLCCAASGQAWDAEPTLHTPRPTRWMPTRGRECRRAGRYRGMCEGPRRTPVPQGPAANRADALSLGTLAAAGRLLNQRPPREWVEAAGGLRERTLLWPVPDGRLGRGFGYVRRKPVKHKLHKGVDITADEGAYVRAANDGLVAYSDNGISGYGNSVLLVHRDGSVTLYAHHRANYVFAGQRVQRGQVIGEVGATGLAWGPHLHFEWRRGGRPRDPLPRMAGRPERPRETAWLVN